MRMSALLLAVVAATQLMNPVGAEDKAAPTPKDRIEEPAKRIKELQKERIATLEKLTEQLTKLAQAGRAEVWEAMDARLQLLRAELDAAEKGADRVALYKKAVDALKKYEELANAQFQAARATESARLKITARRLELEIDLEKAKASEAKDGK